MNQTGGKAPSTPRLSEYATNALEKIRKELRMFSIGDVHNISNSTNGQTHITSHNSLIQNQVECDLNALITHLVATGYTEEQAIAFIKSNGRSELPGKRLKVNAIDPIDRITVVLVEKIFIAVRIWSMDG